MTETVAEERCVRETTTTCSTSLLCFSLTFVLSLSWQLIVVLIKDQCLKNSCGFAGRKDMSAGSWVRTRSDFSLLSPQQARRRRPPLPRGCDAHAAVCV